MSKLLKDQFDKYTKYDKDENRRLEDFKNLNDAIRGDLDHKLDVMLCGEKLEKLMEGDIKCVSSNRRKREKEICSGGKGYETEPIICKCMFHYDRKSINTSEKKKANCDNCAIKNHWTNKSKRFIVIDYEYPMPYSNKIEDIKRVDLVLQDNKSGEIYAVEVKRKASMETISRMMAETLTYTAVLESVDKYGKKEYGMKDGKTLLPAIAFFEDSKQDMRFKEYKKTSEPDFLNLLNTIKVFRIKTSVVKNKNELWAFEFDLIN